MSKNRGAVTKKEYQQKRALSKKTQLLCIGIDRYSNDITSLNNAVRDAKAFERILKERYGVTKIKSLYDKAATLEGIIGAFDDLKKVITQEDNLIIYFSGHGELVDEEGYWVPTDAVLNKRHTYLPNYEVKNFLKTLKAHHVLVIADACFSGALLEKSRSTVARRYYAIPSRWVMTSGQKELVPDGLPGHHSPFAKSLLTQLELNPKPYLSVRELWLDMREGVVANSKQTPLCEPVRSVNHQGGEYYFIDKAAKELPPVPEAKEVDLGPSKQLTTSTTNTMTKTPIKELKKQLRKLQVTEKTREAYELLIEKLDDDSTHMTTVYLRLADYNGLEKDIVRGVAMNVPQRKAQINYALDYIIQNLEAEDLATD